MSSEFNKTVRDFANSLKNATPNKTSPYDTPAVVKRVDGDTAWVHIEGGVDETPVKLTTNAKKGDIVQVRIAGGTAWLTGNATAPPTDDTKAIEADDKAEKVKVIAIDAKELADSAAEFANDAKASAESAAADAGIARDAAKSALTGLSTVESVVDVVNWFAEHKTATEDTTVDSSKTYYIYNASTGLLERVTPEGTENPSEEGWYELTKAISDYVSSHIALTNEGLWVVKDDNSYRLLLTSEEIIIKDEDDNNISVFGKNINLGLDDGARSIITPSSFSIVDETKNIAFESKISETPGIVTKVIDCNLLELPNGQTKQINEITDVPVGTDFTLEVYSVSSSGFYGGRVLHKKTFNRKSTSGSTYVASIPNYGTLKYITPDNLLFETSDWWLQWRTLYLSRITYSETVNNIPETSLYGNTMLNSPSGYALNTAISDIGWDTTDPVISDDMVDIQKLLTKELYSLKGETILRSEFKFGSAWTVLTCDAAKFANRVSANLELNVSSYVANYSYTMNTAIDSSLRPSKLTYIPATACDSNFSNAVACMCYLNTDGLFTINIPAANRPYIFLQIDYFVGGGFS